MKIQKNRQLNKKGAIVVVIVFLLLLAGGVAYLLYISHTKKADVAGTSSVQGAKSLKSDQPAIEGDGSPTGKPGDVTVKKADVVPIISSFSHADGNMLKVSGLVTGIVDQGGKCTFTLQWDDSSRDVTTDAQAGPNSTTCGTAQISLDSIPETSQVTITLTYDSGAYTGTSTNNPTFTVKGISGE